jgi:DNA-binding MarR family transcriptional regulator
VSAQTEHSARPVARLPKELIGCTGFLMVRLGMEFKAHALAELDKAGFSQYHYSVLAMLGEQSCNTQATIADTLGMDRSQLVGILDGLEERRLIVRQRDPDDRRRHVVSLTARGRRELSRLRLTIAQLEANLLEPLDIESRATLHTLLLQLAAHHDPHCYPDNAGQ